MRPPETMNLSISPWRGSQPALESTGYELNQLNGFWSPNDYYSFMNTFKYEQEKVILDKYAIIEESGKRVVYNWLQYFAGSCL